MTKNPTTYLDSPSASFLRKIVILSVILTCIYAYSFLANLVGAILLNYFDSILKGLIFTLIPLIELTATVIFILFFRRDNVRRNARMFAYPVALYAIVNLLVVLLALKDFKWNDLVEAAFCILLALVAADCYFGFKRIGISIIVLILVGAAMLIQIFSELFIKILASPDQLMFVFSVSSLFVMIFSVIPYLIMILFLLQKKAIGERLAASYNKHR
jgi:hypothetical protein